MVVRVVVLMRGRPGRRLPAPPPTSSLPPPISSPSTSIHSISDPRRAAASIHDPPPLTPPHPRYTRTPANHVAVTRPSRPPDRRCHASSRRPHPATTPMPSHRDAGDPSLRSLRRRFPPGDSLRHLAREAFHATAPPSALAPSHAVVHLDICSGSGRCRRRSQSTATTLLPVHHLRLPSLSCIHAAAISSSTAASLTP
jgi:hypothetical protein